VNKRALLLIDAGLVGLAGWLAVTLYDAWPAPPRPGPRPAATSPASTRPEGDSAAPAVQPESPPLAAFAQVADKNLFSPTRTEVAAEPPKPPPAPAAAAAAAAAVPKPRLYGIVLGARDGGRAYLEDPRTRKVFGYTTGDSIADSKVEKIETDRVVMRRGSEVFEVMLRDPSKPRPPPPPPTPAPAAATPGAPQPGGQPVTPPVPFQPVPGAPAPFQPVAPGGAPNPFQPAGGANPFQPAAPAAGVNPFQPATPGTNPFAAPANPGAFQPVPGARRPAPQRPQPGVVPPASSEAPEADE
jgi:hypothetical protein